MIQYSNLLIGANAKAIDLSTADHSFATGVAVYVGGAGNIVARAANNQETVTFTGVVAGTFLPIAVDKIVKTDTTATNLLALY